MLTRLIIHPAPNLRRATNQMRQQVPPRQHFRRGNAATILIVALQRLVLLSRHLTTMAGEAHAQAAFVQCHSLVVQFDWLTSSTTNPPWRFSAHAVSDESYARYEDLATAAWARGLSRWRQRSREFIAVHKLDLAIIPSEPIDLPR